MLPVAIIILAFSADRLTKWWAADFLAENGATQMNPFITIQMTYNRGLAFGMLQGIGSAVGWLSVAIVLGLLVYLTRVPKSMGLLRAGLALIIGGALGNLTDRVIAGQVLDFIQTPIRPGVFNVADVLIQAGVVISLLGIFLQKGKQEDEDQAVEAEREQIRL